MLTIDEVKGATILAVDDNPANLEVLSDYLTEFGFTVLLKQDGEKAVELLQRKLPDLILLDILMPGLDGFETCQRLKQSPDTKDIPVIFMSALTDTVDKIKGFELGAVDYITKPFQYEEVLARVKAHLTIQRLQRDLQRKNYELQELLERERKIQEDLRLNLSITLPHELRTPLSTILGFAQLLMNQTTLLEPTKIVKYAQGIYEGGERLNHLVENALLYANLKLLRYTPHEKWTWQSEMTVEAMTLITAIARKKAAKVRREDDLTLELSPACIRISPDNFEKILFELLDNAFKFSEPGTPVRIKTIVNGHLCILSISDQGHGMTNEQITRIGAYMQFERKRHEQQGTGLGLIICYLLAQLEGGVLSIDSKIGQGTTVSIVFHCEPDRAQTQTQITQPQEAEEFVKYSKTSEPAPPQKILKRLYDFALRTDIQNFVDQLNQMNTLQVQYPQFVKKIKGFVDEYRFDLILKYIGEFLLEKEEQQEVEQQD
ncbi:two-component hybrid sensor and regulator [Candidatus Vecturithrix granuli]|uniref:histidine kinase n=1 Tax=Vecturithrix granuli TaxID=1499967 RepID=A0A081C1N0_VECG1|nr:two-component hybrid sensor and regulator [Candidatus Vecturithrix granuli]